MNPPVGLLLAAGRSERMGTSKALLEIRGETFVARGARILREGGCRRVVVVANPETESEIARALAGVPDVEVVVNPRPEDGMLSSIRLAAARVDEGDAAIVSLVDTPEIEPWWIGRLVCAGGETDEIRIPRFADGDGHPVLLAPCGLARLGEDLPRGLKTLIETAGPRARWVAFGGLRPLDCDTPETYADLRIRHSRPSIEPPPPRPFAATLLPLLLLLFSSAALGLLRGGPLSAVGDARLFSFLWLVALAGGLRGALDDLPGPRDLLPMAVPLLLLGSARLLPYPGVSVYLFETIFVAFLLTAYQIALAMGRGLRSHSGRIRDLGSADVDPPLLFFWWLGVLPPLSASVIHLESLEAPPGRALAALFAIPPSTILGGTGLLLAGVAVMRKRGSRR